LNFHTILTWILEVHHENYFESQQWKMKIPQLIWKFEFPHYFKLDFGVLRVLPNIQIILLEMVFSIGATADY